MNFSFGYFAVLAGSALVFWIYLTYFREQGLEQFRTALYLFTKRNQVHRIVVENHNGLMLPESGPGYVERQQAAIVRRWGRVWVRSTDPRLLESARSRETVYVVRENDPTPLTIGYGAKSGYQGKQVESDEFDALSNLAQRDAAAQAKQAGNQRDLWQSRLTIAVIIAVVGAILSWAGVVFVAYTQGTGIPV